MSNIILIGAGALTRDLVEAFGAAAFAAIYVDPAYAAASIGGLPVLTSWEAARGRGGHYLLGVSDIAHRARAAAAAEAAGLAPAPAMVTHTAIVAADATLAPGAAVGHMVVIGPAARLAGNTLVMHGAVVGHDVELGANSVLCAGVSLGGHVRLGGDSFIGSNAVLAPGLVFGQHSYVAAGAACFRDGPPHSRWIGNPARRVALATPGITS